MLSTKFLVIWPFSKGEEAQIDFQDSSKGGHLGFQIGMILATFDLQVTPILPTKFQVNWPFDSGEAKNRFSIWPPWRPSWIFDWNNFSYFFIYKWPWCFLSSFKSTGLSVQEKKRKIDYQDGRHGPSWISDWNDFSYFLSTNHPDTSY